MSKLNTILDTNPMSFDRNVGVSDSAGEIWRGTEKVKTYLVGSLTFGEHIAMVSEGLLNIAGEHSVDNWDGYDAKAINGESYNNAFSFALSIPSYIPVPDVYVDTDGEVNFEWYEGKRQVFSISIGSKNEIAYAGLFGASKTYGIEPFYGHVPERILDDINMIYSE